MRESYVCMALFPACVDTPLHPSVAEMYWFRVGPAASGVRVAPSRPSKRGRRSVPAALVPDVDEEGIKYLGIYRLLVLGIYII